MENSQELNKYGQSVTTRRLRDFFCHNQSQEVDFARAKKVYF